MTGLELYCTKSTDMLYTVASAFKRRGQRSSWGVMRNKNRIGLVLP